MGKITGFLEEKRLKQPYRPVEERVSDFQQVMQDWRDDDLKKQASRCMDCGVPFCHYACPLGNIIPDWNDLVYRGQWRDAIKRLHATNNFPEFTGTLCPAPCEASCVLEINDQAVNIKAVELAIINKAWNNGWIKPEVARIKTGKKIAIVGSGPAGLAAAQQLVRVGHDVTVFERDDRIGGLLRYGIPEFKMEKRYLDKRLEQMLNEGVIFKSDCNVGNDIAAKDLVADFDVLILTGGACIARDLHIPGRQLQGIHQAMEYLTMQNRACEGDETGKGFISAEGKRVVIIGGGDTGADCLGTANRQGCITAHQLEIMERPPAVRTEDNPWPEWPRIFRISSAHEEGVDRIYSVDTKRFIDDGKGNVQALELIRVELIDIDGRRGFKEVSGSEQMLPCDLVLLAMGFLGPGKSGLLEQLGVALDSRGNVAVNPENWMTNVEGVFAAGDMRRGQSLIVWAIAEGRSVAHSVDAYLMGISDLPVPVTSGMM